MLPRWKLHRSGCRQQGVSEKDVVLSRGNIKTGPTGEVAPHLPEQYARHHACLPLAVAVTSLRFALLVVEHM